MPERDENGRVPFVVVARGGAPAEAMRMVELDGKRGFTDMEADDLARFSAI